MRRILALCSIFVLSVTAFGCTSRDEEDDLNSRDDVPEVVQDFLIDAAIDNNGQEACAYLTSSGVKEAEQAAGTDADCASAFDNARLEVGGQVYDTEDQVEDLDIALEGGEDDPVAVIGTGADAQRIKLVPQTEVESEEFDPPDPNTDWRIDGGIAFLIR